jgi:hypothetical protein
MHAPGLLATWCLPSHNTAPILSTCPLQGSTGGQLRVCGKGRPNTLLGCVGAEVKDGPLWWLPRAQGQIAHPTFNQADSGSTASFCMPQLSSEHSLLALSSKAREQKTTCFKHTWLAMLGVAHTLATPCS